MKPKGQSRLLGICGDEKDGSGPALSHGVKERTKNNEPLTTYTRGIDLSGKYDGAGGAGGLLARSDSQKILPAILCPEYPNPQNVVTSYYFSDDQGNITALVSPSGTILAQYEYDPFGNMISKSGLMADLNKYRFSSKEWEGNAGLYYYGFRFYDPNLQRWLNSDPIQEQGGWNLFTFVGNDPFVIDLFGLQMAGQPIASQNPPTNWTGPTGFFPNGFPANPVPPGPTGGPDSNGPPAEPTPSPTGNNLDWLNHIGVWASGSGNSKNGLRKISGVFCYSTNPTQPPMPSPPPPRRTPPPTWPGPNPHN